MIALEIDGQPMMLAATKVEYCAYGAQQEVRSTPCEDLYRVQQVASAVGGVVEYRVTYEVNWP